MPPCTFTETFGRFSVSVTAESFRAGIVCQFREMMIMEPGCCRIQLEANFSYVFADVAHAWL